MAAKARQVAELARQEMARLRIERKAMEEGTVRRLAEIEAERRAADREGRLHRDREESETRKTEAAERRRVEREQRRKAGERARREAEELAARRRAEAEARRAAEEEEDRRKALAAEGRAKKEEWTRRLRNVGNVAASVLILVIAISGAERLIGWTQPEADPARQTDRSTAADAESRTATGSGATLPPPVATPARDSLAVEPPLIEVEGLDLEAGVSPAPIATPVPLDGFAEAVTRALATYAGSAARFADGSARCGELGGAFAAVDRAWMKYIVNGGTLGELALDATRTERHRGLAREVRLVEKGFAESGCLRP